MNKKMIIAILVLIGVTVLVSKTVFRTKNVQVTQVEETEDKSYYTCPMHPQIHQDHPGECPICHMKLVKVTPQDQGHNSHSENTSRSDVKASDIQLSLIGIQKQIVEKMNLTVRVPVSGRIVSRGTVAFQVYEKDLRGMRPGLKFRGEENIHPEEEILGQISSVDTLVDPTSRTVRVIGSIQKGPKGLISETSFRGEVEIDLHDRIAIPESAVLHTGREDLVYMVSEDNLLKARPVKLGFKTDGFYEVIKGLEVGEVISSGPNFLIDSEAKIRGANDNQVHH